MECFLRKIGGLGLGAKSSAQTTKFHLKTMMFPSPTIHTMRRSTFISLSHLGKNRALSTSAHSEPDVSALRKITKPFLLKCHPDVTVSTTAKEINLNAIQNLNGYLDTIEAMPRKAPTTKKSIVEIDFVLQIETDLGRKKRKHRTSSSRRKVELQLPPINSEPIHLYRFSRRELVKLLHIAGLSIPTDFLNYEKQLNFPPEEEDDLETLTTGSSGQQDSVFERSRRKFMSNIQWQNYGRLYSQAVEEMEADAITTDLLQKYPGRRRTLISAILSRTRLSDQIGFVDQLIAFRRLSLLLDANFSKLHLEEYGRLWETSCRFVLSPPRDYSTSTSSLYRRRRLGLDTGFSFVLHPYQTMSVQVPIDFADDELVRELDHNMWDFYNLVTADDDLHELFPDPVAY